MAEDVYKKPLPPVLDSYLPAIRVDEMFRPWDNTRPVDKMGGFWLNFRLSDLQSPGDIKSIHISMERQTNSHSLLATKQGIAPGQSAGYPEPDEYKRFTRGVMILEFNPSIGDCLDETSASRWKYNTETKEASIYIPFKFPKASYSKESRENFEISEALYNSYYKVQIRFSSKNPPPYDSVQEEYPWDPKWFVHKKRPAVGQRLANHLTNESNLPAFSEWSTIGLVRLVAPRVFNNAIFDTPNQGNDPPEYSSSMLTIKGDYIPTDIEYMNPGTKIETETGIEDEDPNLKNTNPYYYLANGARNDEEYLFSYQIKVYKDNNNNDLTDDELIHTSEILKPLKTNQIEYNVPCYLQNENIYRFDITFTTANIFEETISRKVQVSYSTQSWNQQSVVEPVEAGLDSVIGKVSFPFNGWEVTPQGQSERVFREIPVGTVFNIRRGDDKDNFGYWPLLYQKKITESGLTHVVFDDFTIESGVLYKYEITMTLPTTGITYSMENIMILSVFDHAFLTGGGKQLSVKFNPNISTFRRNVSDSVVNTIGGKYPYVTRNSYMNYRSFSLSGTIAYEMDLERQFASRSSIYGEWFQVYGSYFVNHFMNPQNDKVTQRKFRELVMNYLYDDKPKIFRSTPEGNILVRITDVTLTPNQTTGRMIYDFSCTATEIGDATIPNYQLYEIQDFGDL